MNLLLPLVLVLLGAFAPLVDAAHVWADRVKQTSTITGTGSYSLDPSVPTGFQGFVTAIGNGNTTDYLATDGTNWEIVSDGVVTYSTPDTLSRPTICSSSNGGAAVNWSAADVTIVTVNSSCNLEDTGYKSLDEIITGDWVFSSSFTSPGIDDNADSMAITIDSNEKVVIGNTSTTYDLELFREGTTPDMAITGYSTDPGSGPKLYFNRNGGTVASPAAVDNGDFLGITYYQGYTGSAFTPGAYELATASETWSGSAHGTSWELRTTANGSTSLLPRISVDSAGGTTISTAFTSPGIDDNADATAITIDSSENVGVGGSPSYPLHIMKTGTNASLGVERTDGAIAFMNATDTYGQFGTADSTNLRLLSNGTAKAIIDTNGKFGIGPTITAVTGVFGVKQTNAYFSISASTTINDEASSAVESLVDGGTDGILRVFWDAGYACEFLIEGSGNAVIEVTDPRNKCSATDADTFLVVMADGDSTYTIKNRLGTQTAFTLIFMGRG